MYRRNSPRWHGRNADPVIYCQGSDFPVVETRWGSMAVAICGDLFDDSFVSRIRADEPRYLLWPIARCFNDGSFDQLRWDWQEEPQYLERARLTGCTTLMVNKLGDRSREECPSFGGALAVSSKGEAIARWPLGRRGILHVDI
jgi:predicted amidohydrolase